jgi:hypothetical protein
LSGPTPWDYHINPEAVCSIYNVFARGIAPTVVEDVQRKLDDALQDAQNAHAELDEGMRVTAEEGQADLKRTREECINDLEILTCDMLHDFRGELKEIKDEEIREYSVVRDWRINTARNLVLERSRIEKAKEKLEKEEERLKETVKKLEQERELLKNQEVKLKWKEHMYAENELKLDKMEDEYVKNKADRTSETEDE